MNCKNSLPWLIGIIGLCSSLGAAAGYSQLRSSFYAAIADDEPGDLPHLHKSQDLHSAPPGPSGIVWNSDSSMLAAYGEWSNVISIWNADGTVLQQLRRGGDHFGGNALAFVAHNSEIAARPAKTGPADVVVSVFDIRTGAVVHELPSQQPGQEAAFQRALALASSPDGSLLAVAFGGGEAEPVALYDTATWRKLADIPSRDQLRNVTDQAKALAFSRDGRLLAIGKAGEVLIYDVQANRIAQRIKPFSEQQELGCCVSAVSFNQDATEIAVSSSLTPGSANGREGLRSFASKTPVRVIRLADGATVASFPDPLWPVHSHSMSWSPDGAFIAFIIRDKLHIWDPSSPAGKHNIYAIRPDAVSLAFAPNNKSVAVGNSNYVSVYDIVK